VVIVKVASECGLTPRSTNNCKHFTKSIGEGPICSGFPFNQFGWQEPGTAVEIGKSRKSNYGVEFDLFAKIEVICPV